MSSRSESLFTWKIGDHVFCLQVEIPSRAYGGHQPQLAMTRGIIPNSAHGDLGPQKSRERMPNPTTILTVLSIVPIFLFTHRLLCGNFLLEAKNTQNQVPVSCERQKTLTSIIIFETWCSRWIRIGNVGNHYPVRKTESRFYTGRTRLS